MVIVGNTMAVPRAPTLTDEDFETIEFVPFWGQPPEELPLYSYAWLRDTVIGAEVVIRYARGHTDLLRRVLGECAPPTVEVLRSAMR